MEFCLETNKRILPLTKIKSEADLLRFVIKFKNMFSFRAEKTQFRVVNTNLIVGV